MNPHGYHPIGSSLFGRGFASGSMNCRGWTPMRSAKTDNLSPSIENSSLGYSFRHTYAQRHADAGTAPDVLMTLMGHEKSQLHGVLQDPAKATARGS